MSKNVCSCKHKFSRFTSKHCITQSNSRWFLHGSSALSSTLLGSILPPSSPQHCSAFVYLQWYPQLLSNLSQTCFALNFLGKITVKISVQESPQGSPSPNTHTPLVTNEKGVPVAVGLKQGNCGKTCHVDAAVTPAMENHQVPSPCTRLLSEMYLLISKSFLSVKLGSTSCCPIGICNYGSIPKIFTDTCTYVHQQLLNKYLQNSAGLPSTTKL